MRDKAKKDVNPSALSIRPHDYRNLISRWKSLSRKYKLDVETIAKQASFPIIQISSDTTSDEKFIYLSAGIHGDEVGATEGLFEWARVHLSQFRSFPFVIFPCLNPWGLINNSRWDQEGVDLNRVWDSAQHPVVGEIMKRIKNMKIGLALTLHEDYDANGIYLFEPFSGGPPSSMAENILSHASKVIPRDLRSKIEGRTCRQGIIRPRPNKPPPDGIPEALHLYHANKCTSFTFETPSEFDLQRRVHAQTIMIEKAISYYLDTR